MMDINQSNADEKDIPESQQESVVEPKENSSEKEQIVEEEAAEIDRGRFPIIGLGASAGGLQAFTTFFENLPDQPGMAFVLVQHLDPHHESELAELIQNHTAMEVTQFEDRTEVQQNKVYVIPPGKSLSIKDRVLYLTNPDKPRGQRAPIDLFFRSLAEDQTENAICIILSGTGSDGSLGLKAIKEYGGVVMAQSPETAEYNDMPRNAVHTGLVDVVESVEVLAQKLVEYRQSAQRMRLPDSAEELGAGDADVLHRIFAQLQNHTGHDFKHYKRSTILRRIQRRMQVTQSETLASYLNLIRSEKEEAEALFKDFLISVTNFFRDEESFAVLEKEVIPNLFRNKKKQDQIRVWVPGCATGEEAYSIAILLLEEAFQRYGHVQIQVFATDLDVEALDHARHGLYSEAISADVTPERLRRFFRREKGGYRISKELQEIVLFAPHNLIKDAPFSRLNLISCRNLLIYLNREVQKRVFEIFHYALTPNGFLFLGESESADVGQDLFRPLRKQQRIYKRRDVPSTLPRLPLVPADDNKLPTVKVKSASDSSVQSIGDWHRDLMLNRYAPASVIVDASYQIRYLFGDIGRFLARYEGEPSDNILDNVSQEIRLELRTGLFFVFRNRKAAQPRDIVFHGDGSEAEHLRLKIEPVQREGVDEPMALVVFEPVLDQLDLVNEADKFRVEQTLLNELEEELKETRHRLQTIVEEYETSNEELKASNEELQSMNEELRSTAEELETGREELQSTNEELTSVNQELKSKIGELHTTNSDLENLMKATNIPILFLDRELRLKRYTPEATEIFNIIPTDLGRPFSHLSHKIDRNNLLALAEKVLKDLEVVHEDVRSVDGISYLLQMRPYRTLEDKIEGVVITLIDISTQVEAEQKQRILARQQTVVAELGQMALKNSELSSLMDTAVHHLTEVLNVDFAKVLEVQPGESDLLLKAGIGWKKGAVGHTLVETNLGSQAGYSLTTHSPVIVEDLRKETRFKGSSLLVDHNVISGISVIIHGFERPYGVLGVHTAQKRKFNEQDVAIVQSVANTLATAVQHHNARREREELLARIESERQRLQNIFWHAPANIAIFEGPEHIYTFMNLLHLRLVNNREVIGKTVREAFPELKGQGFFEIMDDVFKTGETKVVHESPILFDFDDDGNVETAYHDIFYTPYRNNENNIIGVMGFGFDVTPQVKARQQIENERRLLETVVDNMPSSLVVAEAPSGRITMFNRASERLVKRPMPIAKSLEDYAKFNAVDADGKPFPAEKYPIVRALSGEAVKDQEILYKRGDGQLVTLSVNSAPIRDSSGEVIMAISVSHDISQIKGLQAELEAWNRQLEERVDQRTVQIRELATALTLAEQRERERISRFLHDDLQQLLHAIQVNLVVLASKKNDEQFAEQLKETAGLASNAISLTRSLTVELSPPVLKNEGLAQSLGWLIQQMSEMYNLKVNLTITEESDLLNRDMEELAFQMVRELLFNVIKHADSDSAQVTMWREDEICAIQVSDTGNGFNVKILENQAPQGFGLFNIRERIQLFGGQMLVESEPGNGTAITLNFPVVKRS